MESQRNDLLELAATHGWNATKTDNFDAHEWSVETWELESVWSPVAVKAYATFPIDEQIYTERIPWAIRVTAEAPAHGVRPSFEFESSLVQWKNEKQKFVECLDRIRTMAKS